MTPSPFTHDLFGDELDRTASVIDVADRLLTEAELVYSPNSAQVPTDFVPNRQSLTGWLKPDRLLLDPIWYLLTTVAHVILGTLLLGSVTLATAILAVILWVVIDRHIGIPLMAASAVCVGLLAAGGTVAAVFRSFSQSLSRCPW